MDIKQGPYIFGLQETHFGPRDAYTLKVVGWKKKFHTNGNGKKARVAILISNKIDLKIKNITRDKEGHYIIVKESIQEEDITIVIIYAPNIAAHQCIGYVFPCSHFQSICVFRSEVGFL